MTNKKTNVAKKAQEKNSELLPVTKADVPRTIEVLKAQLAEKRKNIDQTVSLNISYQGTNIKNVKKISAVIN